MINCILSYIFDFIMENLFVTATNLYALRAIKLAFEQQKYLECGVLSCATIASIVYHLSETKHSMKSLCFKNSTRITLNMDRFFAFASVLVFLFKYNKMIKNKEIIFYGITSLVAQMLSESQHLISFSPSTEKTLYLITHPIWHIGAFHIAYLLLKYSV